VGDKEGLPKVNALAQWSTPIASKADTPCGLDLIRDETIQPRAPPCHLDDRGAQALRRVSTWVSLAHMAQGVCMR
jgi:hypothetical protein